MPSVHRAVVALPFLVALAPIAHLWAENSAVVRPSSVVLPVVLTMLMTAFTLIVLRFVTGDAQRAALSVTVAWVPILTFGYQADWLGETYPDAGNNGTIALLGLNGVAVAVLVAMVWRASRGVQRVSEYLTFAVTIFVLLAVPAIVAGVPLADRPIAAEERSRPQPEVRAPGPDIYYIVLDGYGRADVFAELYDHDNLPFLSALEKRGFFIADESFSNYAITPLSLAAVLNMRYVNEIHDPLALGADVRAPLRDLIHYPQIVRRLEEFGYRYVHFDTTYWGTDDAPLADVRYSWDGWLESEFAVAFLRTTMLRYVLDLAPVWHQRHLYTLEHLEEIPEIEGPTFTFAHLFLPHPPYVFDSTGRVLRHEANLVGGWDQPEAYIEQLKFLNSQLEKLVDALLIKSESSPVIILQGDHGPAKTLYEPDGDVATIYWERMAILNAQLLPASARSTLYPSVSPVNTFRVVLNEVFGEHLPLLPDWSFFNYSARVDSPAVRENHLELRDVTEIVRSRR